VFLRSVKVLSRFARETSGIPLTECSDSSTIRL
jgi:hypothetical protein